MQVLCTLFDSKGLQSSELLYTPVSVGGPEPMAGKTPVLLGDEFNCVGSETDTPSLLSSLYTSWSFNAEC